MHLTLTDGRAGAAPAPRRRRRPVAGFGLAAGLLSFLAGALLVVMQLGLLPGLRPVAPAPVVQSPAVDSSLVAPPPEPDYYGWQIRRFDPNAAVSDGPVDGVAFDIRIPAIGYSATVREGTGADILDQGPGHYIGTAWPGQVGNVGVAGHNTFWLAFGDLKAGDRVSLLSRRGVFTYEITGSRVVDPSDRTVLVPTADPQLTLTTCYPLWAGAFATKRLIFSAQLVDWSN